jgi:hypothetical protein
LTPEQKGWIKLIAAIMAACLFAWATSATCAHFLNPSACRAILR